MKTNLKLNDWEKQSINQKVDRDWENICAFFAGLKVTLTRLRAGLRFYALLLVRRFSNTR